MKLSSPEQSLRLRLGIGFSLILLLMLLLTGFGIERIADINQRMQRIVNENNVKVEQAHIMKDAQRARTVITHTILLLSDPFEQNEEFLEFSNLAGVFTAARAKLEGMSFTPEEKVVLARMREITLKTQPLAAAAVDKALSGDIDEARSLIRNEVVELQRLLALEINNLLVLQKTDTERAVAETTQAYKDTRLLLLVLGGAAAVVGLMIAVVVIRNTRKQAGLLQHQAMFDNLTNLPNRALFADRLQQAILIGRREKQPFALIAMDLDRFKEINDSLGHNAGDRVLQHVATRVRACLRESDTVARMGGDEFTILLATADSLDGAQAAAKKILKALEEPFDIGDRKIEIGARLGTATFSGHGEGPVAIEESLDSAQAAAKKILKALEEPFDIGGQKIEIGASLGIAMFPEHGEDPELLLREADAAMYIAKQTHGGYKVYSKELGQGADDRTALQADLRRAVSNNELVLYYQPKIDFGSDRISGVEALVRWQHPKLGLLAPDKFIPLAEQTGLIKSMTLSILRSALRQSEEWQRAGLNLTMAVNISAINIQDPEFPGQMAKILSEFAVSASHLELEITETAVMSEPVRAVECIKKLSAMGLQISIDDFGTGYSSMAYLKELLVAKIKIDKSFVKDMAVNHNDAVIVRSTIELGHNLGLKVIAEGVETQACWDRLKTLGCDSAQGYHMARPLPADKFREWLGQSKWGTKA